LMSWLTFLAMVHFLPFAMRARCKSNR
jgi:hypothetical protein